MDPNANLEFMLVLARDLVEGRDEKDSEYEQAVMDLAGHVIALHDRLSTGGALPDAWGKVAWANGVSVAQGYVLAGRVISGDVMRVTKGGAGLPDDYLYVTYERDPFVCGIAPDGRISS